ncbi:MAG: hypothetical protein ACD_20C00406G0009 [uncultured bacterium]|nr:MAG: hypothetical protein ACD_20C00406G0009 [uncultured bacterium]HBH18185.1 NADH-quinone oxidoreductase subunit NuoE [Cyanobacteria bacterium UBA9579]
MKAVQVDKDVREIVQKCGHTREYLIPILQELVAKKGYLTEELIRDVAHEMAISPNEVYSVATFYSFINTKPTGKYVIRICKTISCDLAGKDEIIKALEKELRVKLGSTTDDRLFTLEVTSCIGMCDQGPAMLVNDAVYSKIDSKKAVEIVKEYKNKEK